MPFSSSDLTFGFFLAALAAIGLGSLIGHHSRFYHTMVDREIASSRFQAIDGLRGYLALGVMLHHIHLNHHLYRTGLWELTPSRLSTFMGRGSVAFFFMITAFLFWSRAVDMKGRVDTIRFYGGRVRRLLPMYLVSASLLVLTAVALTHFRLNVPPLVLARQVFSWMLFTAPGYPEINGFPQTTLINTVYWSLVYEWKFYLALPFIAALCSGRGRWLCVICICGYIAFFSALQIEWFFVSGCVAASLVRIKAVQQFSVSKPAAVVAIGCVAATVACEPLIYTPLGAALLLVPFTIIAGGNSLFGSLTCRPARVLGLLSYSIYLLHNWVLYLASRLVNHYLPVEGLPHVAYLGLALAVAVSTLLLSAITYRFIEYPSIRSVALVPKKMMNEATTVARTDGL